MTKLKNYQIIQTQDGSETLFSQNFNEACHSTAGAVEETKLHYIQGCQISRFIEELDKVYIMEIGLGAGVGLLETLATFKDSNTQLFFLSFELDETLIEYVINKLGLNFSRENNFYHYKDEMTEILFVAGNARETVKQVEQIYSQKFHAIYQDAFSPKRNATLWTTQWFRDLKKCADINCIMSTYSASSAVRKAMIAADWKVYKGEKFGPKRSSTRAKLTGESDTDIIEQLTRSGAPELTDEIAEDYILKE